MGKGGIMTKVTIDIRNIASSTHADDRVLFRSPTHRAGGAGLISTANEVVTLTAGVGDVELTPGPVIVTFQCKGVTDTAPKRGTVPDTGPVPLVDVISGSFSYTPEVTTATQAARDDAVDAAGQAKDYRDAAADSADAAAASAGLAASSLSGAQDLAADVSDDVAQAASSRDQAVQAATDTASALDGRIPADLALRVDTTVGTRIFAGDTMIHGDTGWRDVTMHMGDIVGPANTGSISVRRIGNRVLWRFNNFLLLSGSGGLSFLAPPDLRMGWRAQMHWGTQTVVLYNDLSFTNNITHLNSGGWYWLNQFAEYTGALLRTRPVKGLTGVSDFTTLDPWPTSLPGTPA